MADKNEKDARNTDSKLTDRASQEQNDRSFSGGMHSLDSTQVPLRTSDGEPDWDAIKGDATGPDQGNSKDKNSKDK